MTREETIEAIKVMQAYVDGKGIEAARLENTFILKFESLGEEHVPFNFYRYKYRIKEEHSKCPRCGLGRDCAHIPEEPKPFDWRGKNIQWIKFSDHIASLDAFQVRAVSDQGICVRYLVKWSLFYEWEELLSLKGWQWSEDNKRGGSLNEKTNWRLYF